VLVAVDGIFDQTLDLLAGLEDAADGLGFGEFVGEQDGAADEAGDALVDVSAIFDGGGLCGWLPVASAIR